MTKNLLLIEEILALLNSSMSQWLKVGVHSYQTRLLNSWSKDQIQARTGATRCSS